jgi:hypothetical protein
MSEVQQEGRQDCRAPSPGCTGFRLRTKASADPPRSFSDGGQVPRVFLNLRAPFDELRAA